MVAPGGVLVVNSSHDQPRSRRARTSACVMVPANEIAESLGDKRMTNMVLLGALLANLPVLPLEAVEKALKAHLPERHHHLLPLNYQCLRKGAEYVAQLV